jgi:hypothetical protein
MFARILFLVAWCFAATAQAQMGMTGAGAASRRLDCRDVGTNAIWLDGSDASTITTSTGISSWADKSGNSRTATQATGSAQPTVVTAAQNGRNAIRFTSSASQFLTLNSAITGSSGYTQIAVLRRAGPSGTNQTHVFGKSTGEGFSLRWWSDARLYHTTPTRYVANDLFQSTTAFAVATTDSTAADGASQWLNGVSLSLAIPAGLGTTTFDVIGKARNSTEYGNYDLLEVCLWTGNLSSTDRSLMWARFNQKWGLY